MSNTETHKIKKLGELKTETQESRGGNKEER